MKKITLSAFAIMLLMLTLFFSCKKKKGEIYETANTNGRIIGYNPCRHFIDGGKASGTGFVIENDKGTIKDTAVTYNIPENLFVFQYSYIDGSYSSFLFRPEV